MMKMVAFRLKDGVFAYPVCVETIKDAKAFAEGMRTNSAFRDKVDALYSIGSFNPKNGVVSSCIPKEIFRYE